ncbi:MAG: ABC transporter permease DevC [Cyanobacteria bacterium P01_E01_bin.6]
MRTPLAWLNLLHERTRLMVAIAGVTFAVTIIFMNLGFLGALALTANQTYASINANIFVISPLTLELSTTEPFPIERIYQAAGIDGVERVMPMYVGYGQWRNPTTRINRAMLMYGVNPNDVVFLMPELQGRETIDALRQPNTVLYDRRSRPEFGPQDPGIETELERRRVTIVGNYDLGGGFAADGTVITSDLNFSRYLEPRPLNLIDFGLIQLDELSLADSTSLAEVKERIQNALPEDVIVLTRDEIAERDRAYWIETTAAGFIFSMGVTVAMIVGTVIVYQILYTDIANHMAEFATLKAMGYRGMFLFKVVIEEAIILACLGYGPGFLVSISLYTLARNATGGTLPVYMDVERAIWVFVLTLIMCTLSGLVSVQKAVQADPAEVFS